MILKINGLIYENMLKASNITSFEQLNISKQLYSNDERTEILKNEI